MKFCILSVLKPKYHKMSDNEQHLCPAVAELRDQSAPRCMYQHLPGYRNVTTVVLSEASVAKASDPNEIPIPIQPCELTNVTRHETLRCCYGHASGKIPTSASS